MSRLSLAKRIRGTLFRAAIIFALVGLETGVTGSEPAVPLGRAAKFTVLANTSVNNGGISTITGNVGVWPGAVLTGFPPGTISGTVHTGNVASADAQADLAIAYNDAASRTPDVVLVSPELGGLTLTGGVYQTSGPLQITSGNLTLNARGNSNAVFIVQGSSLFTAPGQNVVLAGGAQAGRIFWQLTEGATINSIVKGNVLANSLIEIQNGANLEGRALSLAENVVLNAATVRVPSSSGPSPTGLLVIESASVVALNPQTGLFEQTVRVRNAGSNAVAAAQVWVKNVPFGVTVYNSVGTTVNRHPYVVYNRPLGVGSTVDLVIEYFRTTRRPFLSPSVFTKAIAPQSFSQPAGQRQSILRKVPIGSDRMLVEFVALPARRYAMQYSDDGIIWKTAQPFITARADRVFWIDYGAPKTEGTPTSARSYRVARPF
jgi:hypothetical protein